MLERELSMFQYGNMRRGIMYTLFSIQWPLQNQTKVGMKGCKGEMLPNKNLKANSQHNGLKLEFLL